MSLPNFDIDKKWADCLVCGDRTHISSVTGARVHVHAPDPPHNPEVDEPEAER